MTDPVIDPPIEEANCEKGATSLLMILVVFFLMLGLGATVTTKQMRQQNLWLIGLGFLS